MRTYGVPTSGVWVRLVQGYMDPIWANNKNTGTTFISLQVYPSPRHVQTPTLIQNISYSVT